MMRGEKLEDLKSYRAAGPQIGSDSFIYRSLGESIKYMIRPCLRLAEVIECNIEGVLPLYYFKTKVACEDTAVKSRLIRSRIENFQLNSL